MGKSKADERPYWTLEEFQKFSDAIMDKRDSWMAFQILFWTGMRIGELLALQVKDVNFEDGTIRVDESLTRLDGEDLITAPKTESSVRVITIHKELQDEIREYISTLYRPKPGTRLFAGRTKSFFEHEMERGIKLSGVKKIAVHCTRHSHARDNNQNTRNPCKHWFAGVSFYPIPSIWCLFGVCSVKICSISSAVFFLELSKTAVYVPAVI